MVDFFQNINKKLRETSYRCDREGLGSEKLAIQIQRTAFSDETLELKPETNSITGEKDFLHFQATAVKFLGVYQQPVKVVFFILDEQLECLITATLPEGWDFSWHYPYLPDYSNYADISAESSSSFFYDFQFSQPLKILFCSCDAQKISNLKDKLDLIDISLEISKVRQGLNYFSKLDLTNISFLSILTTFVGIQKARLPFYGYLEQKGEDEQLKLSLDLNLSKTYENIFKIGISSLVFYTDISFFSIPAQSGIVLLGELAIGNTQQSPQNIELIWPIGSTHLIIKNSSPFPFPGFETFKKLLQGHLPGDSSNFPIADNLPTLNIREIVLHLSLDTLAISNLSLTVSTPDKWRYPILNEALVIEELLFNWQVTSGSHKQISFGLLGAFQLGGGLVSVGSTFPDFVFYGELALYQRIELKRIFEHFLPNATLPEVSILDLAVTADIKQGDYTLELEIASDWEIKLGSASILPLKQLKISIEKDNDSSFAAIDSIINIAGVDIILLATYFNEKGTSGWTFSGSTGSGQEVPIGRLMEDLSKAFGVSQELPTAIETLVIENLRTSFNTEKKDFYFACEAKFNLNSEEIDIDVAIDITRNKNENFQNHFGGSIALADLYFSLSFDRNPNSKTFIATYNNPTGKSQSIKALVASVSNAIAEIVPDGLTITLKDALFAYSATTENNKTETKVLFILHIDSGINLSSLSLVGKLFPPNQTIQVHYQLLAASHYFSQDDVQHLNTLVTNGISQLPAQPIGNENNRSKSYFGLAVTLQLGDAIEQLNLPITVDSSSGQIAPIPKTTDRNSNQSAPSNKTTDPISENANLPTSESVKWYPLKKSFGPVHFQKIGVKCQEQKLWFLLDASLATAGLTISLDGLAVSSPLTELKPEFHLNGIGIDYRSDTIEIGGAFLKAPDKDEYSGAAILRTQTKGKQLTLSAFGSYTYYEGHPSLFVYALLDYPLGGAPFLFVTGLAAGFGYNRTLRLPEKVEDVAQFPLVKIATGETTNFTELDSYISPATGELFFAVGIKFTSFKIIDSFALLTVQLGNRSEINVLGLSTLIAPPPENKVEPIAKAQLAFRATYLPDEGFLKAEAALLPGAYLFSGNCRLSGRFAFYSWFSGEHEGNFVLTLGGYHPDFNIPEHYPKLPRLQLNWQLDNKTFIKGDSYFALCSHTLMAGGHLELTYQNGDFKAWLKAGADFLIAWKPYHYDARIYVTIGASYTFNFSLLFTTVTKTITAEIGADLHLWGPDFGGTATIHIWVVQINIDFGSSSSQQPNPIDWNSFKASFLPKDEEVCSIAVQDGLIRKIGNDKSDLGIINPKHFSLVTNSAIPSKDAYKQKASSEGKIKVDKINTTFGIASMAVQSGDLITKHIITITRNGQNVEKEFQYIPILKKVPTGLWGPPPSNDKPLTPSVNGQQFIENVLSGFEIKPDKTHDPGQTQAVDRVNLQYEPEPAANRYSWETQIPFQADSSEDSDRRDRIRATLTKNSKRENLLKSLGFDPDRDVDLNEAIANDFIIPPQIKHLKNFS